MDANAKIKKIRKDMETLGYPHACKLAISAVSAELRDVQKSLSDGFGREIVVSMSSRIKSPESIYEKLVRKQLAQDFKTAAGRFNDIAGIRVVCQFQDDVYTVAQAIRESTDYKIIKEKDYVAKPKKNGYRSLHIILAVPVEDKEIRLEVQVRSMAMDFWSVAEYELLYKKDPYGKAFAKKKLKGFASELANIDMQMVALRTDVAAAAGPHSYPEPIIGEDKKEKEKGKEEGKGI